MATPDKKTRPPRPPSARQLWVVIEDNNAHFKVFGEGLAALREEVGRLDRTMTEGFAHVDRELTLVNSTVGRVDREMAEGFARVDREMAEGFARVDLEMTGGFARVDRELTLVKSAVLENGREMRDLRGELGEVRGGVKRVEDALEKKVDRDEVEAIVGRVLAASRG